MKELVSEEIYIKLKYFLQMYGVPLILSNIL